MFIIDLDSPPSKRWTELITFYKKPCQLVFKTLSKMIDNPLLSTIGYAVINQFVASDKIMYREELQSIAKILEIKLEKLVLAQLCYEMAAACTTVVVGGTMFRTMDWPLDCLKQVTCLLEFRKGGKTVFKAVSWAGHVGVLTGMLPGSYSMAVNYRRSNGTIIDNVERAMTLAWPIGYLCRDILENSETYDEARRRLKDSRLISPCYVVMCNTVEDSIARRQVQLANLLSRAASSSVNLPEGIRTQSGQGSKRQGNGKGKSHTITRDAETCVKCLTTDNYLIQTNKDYKVESKDNILFSIEREKLARGLVKSGCEMDELKQFPIINGETIYVCVLKPVEGELIVEIDGKLIE